MFSGQLYVHMTEQGKEHLRFFLNPEEVSFILSESNQGKTIHICIPCHCRFNIF